MSQNMPLTPLAARDPERLLRAVSYLALALVVGWHLIGVTRSTAQWGDHFEQFVWAHGLEWGYHKHPPLPTWMLAAAIGLFGPSVEWAEVLAMLCTAATGFFTYRVAK